MWIRISPARVLCFVGVLLSVNGFAEPSEMAERLKQAEVDLKNSRESLHVAHQELGEKAEQIAKLESRLEKAPGARRKKGVSVEVVSKLRRDLQIANSKIKTLERKLEAASVAAEKKKEAPKRAEPKVVVEKSAKSPEPRVFRVSYEANSAASLKGRELALKWIVATLKRSPGMKFSIRGHANDTEFEEANRAIADNRANFLASFLRVSGVPAAAISEVKGDKSSEGGASGRIVEILELP